tara:strand:- start:199 stop:423 length:225 start_codon:yes stop_codon:yes gene_type:complete
MRKGKYYILILLIFFPQFLFAQDDQEFILLTNNMLGQSTLWSINLLFWSKLIVLILIAVLGIFAYKRFLSKKEH